MNQSSLFGNEEVHASIPGLVYQPEFLSVEEERELIDTICTLPLHAAKYKQYLARRRVMSFGGSYDFDTNQLLPASSLDARLLPLRDRVAAWQGVPAESLVHALVAEYAPGTPLGWHRDVPNFERIIGISLGSEATLRFRPYPYRAEVPRQVVELCVQPRSVYVMADEARWGWQHCVEATRGLRWSITFRDFRGRTVEG
ncbi:alpha-ketoglutarate-dependent dioxygenase AlkB [Comamonas endophytica]|uniref:Alpha-ketoglutarate-dependent dioxygenase AlkB n=1 Tax=Comamonas endophytica TaxID=2949090 RepID=A0ABY6GG76_9BURK|nr:MULTISPECIES: alpha-ketoglutarate-dependent dioxygenase AlkB [unclassified Acidovorax]MCD2513358.1 alpha-ketoglutarate-dependent dioxygenase AlkB [Acidovorax sp. D4N7]UYG53858.1 alpha-ketoglutarate-dependent dioxygenase AlkB [Acidovorax sp. 5MLIR]